MNDDVKRVNLCFWSFVDICAFCEVGQMVTNQFDEFEVELEKCKWYLFETKFQRNYLIFLSIAEQPTTTYGYGHIECLRASLKKVISHVYTSVLNVIRLTKKNIFFISIQYRPLVQASLISWRFVNLIEICHLRL